jgi:hypothetical protein
VPKRPQGLEQTSLKKPNNFLFRLEPKTTETKHSTQKYQNRLAQNTAAIKPACDIQRYRRRQKYN